MTNPLLEIQYRIPFDKIKAEDVQPAIQELLGEAREQIDTLINDSTPRTFENTLERLDSITERLEFAIGVVRHLEGVATYPELRAAYNAVQPEVSAFYASLPLNPGLWKAVQAFHATPEAEQLTPVRRRFLKKTVDSFRRHGAELDPAGKKRMEEIDVELSKLTTAFGEHVLDATNAYELVIEDEAALAGLPESARAAARASAAAKQVPGYRFTLQAPSYLPLMTYLDDRKVRREMYEAFNRRATADPHDNRELLTRILALRREKARLLGFHDFADLVLDDRMAHTGERAQQFLEDLYQKSEPQFRRENEDLYKFRQSLEGADAPALQPWDVSYYAEKQRKALYDFDEEALRPYFPLKRVVTGMFQTVERLFGVRVQQLDGVPVWDPAVTCYEIRDLDGTLLGSFYADWYPRENKRGGAWMDAFLTGVETPHGLRPHVGAICGNLTPPVENKPALLTHREVETIWHEFGHLLHHCLSRVEVRSLAGTNVAWDFVELPSQIMENWCWEREALDLFALHYETGEPIPDDLFQKMKRARTFRAANGQMRQLGFGIVDLSLHREYDPERDGDVLQYGRRILQQFSAAPLPEPYGMLASFTHLFSSPVGYGAGYYSYKWAEVLDADAFTRFRANGIFSEEAGRAYREAILSKGDSDDPAELYRRFMGRDPDPNALLERLGLVASVTN